MECVGNSANMTVRVVTKGRGGGRGGEDKIEERGEECYCRLNHSIVVYGY